LTFFCNETDLTDEKIKQALKVACAEFVFELPEGLQTKLSERGGGLSEGQLQRLAVARAVLSNRPILLLDEATSALDNETEKRMLQNIKNLQDKTCLIVTHRIAALSIADEVWSVENKKVVVQ
jgi:ATP-binding cassette subfamily B protein